MLKLADPFMEKPVCTWMEFPDIDGRKGHFPNRGGGVQYLRVAWAGHGKFEGIVPFSTYLNQEALSQNIKVDVTIQSKLGSILHDFFSFFFTHFISRSGELGTPFLEMPSVTIFFLEKNHSAAPSGTDREWVHALIYNSSIFNLI